MFYNFSRHFHKVWMKFETEAEYPIVVEEWAELTWGGGPYVLR